MAKRSDPQDLPKNNTAREDRLKAALKANMMRRKEQARARTQSQGAEAGDSARAGAEKDR
ncbi:hypothetical protein So717_25940 [Roseobacter cerasinus]|uniref:Uncharacterized protein n=1 Tax=Roseobacter cerasinus TaxID=2602289 RepID=A0A640VUS2_9RHOB|nr:hypothetical protein [Roseobacter cerasinus]GFE50841.1 hypothetical protein So717_25940 [Roseobacter cerasinus]